jgi:hypothetical protein
MEQWWNNTNNKNPRHSEKNLYQSQFIHHKPHMNMTGIETGSLNGEVDD